jgi:flagellar protein FlaG
MRQPRKEAIMISAASPPVAGAERPAPGHVAVIGGGAPTVEVEKRPLAEVKPPPRVEFDPIKLRENLSAAVEHLNRQLASSGRTLGFSIDEILHAPIVTVKNTSTGEVVRQIPSEAVVKVAHTLEELKGLLYDASS